MSKSYFSCVALVLLVVPLLLAACTPATSSTLPVATSFPAKTYGLAQLTPQQFRAAYGITALHSKGFTGKGQTIVVIDSFGSPTLQTDMDAYDQRYQLPPITIQVLSPLGTVPFNTSDKDMLGWAGETELDVQMIHTVAPDAAIVVMTSPVSETEGTIGLPEFRQLETYAVQHHLGTIVSQSWGVSEVTLTDKAGRDELALWDAFYQQATTQEHVTFFTGSGDNGATDYKDLKATQLSPTATTSFPSDNQWVTAAGGTTLSADATASSFREAAWSGSGGGFSAFYPTPTFQQTLPSAVQKQLNGKRGVPDVAGSADPRSGLIINFGGDFRVIGGTSAAAPFWAGLMAIANQMAGHPLGYINPALYKLGASSAYTHDFHDITAGNNSVNTSTVSVPGYPAVAGWDPVTGLGSPVADTLLPDLINMVDGK